MALNKAFEEIKEKLANIHRVVKDDADLEWNRAVYNCEEIVNEVAKKYAGGWIPCGKKLPPQPKENPKIDNRPIEIYLVVSEDLEDYPFRAFWNGKIFTDGFSKVDVVAWQPLPEPYRPE